jgi:hypothetical protein
VTLHRDHLRGKFCKQGSHISRSGSYFQNFVRGSKCESFQHAGDDIGLRDGLTFADGQRMILIGLMPVRFGNELVARHTQHGVEHALVGDSARAKLRFDHPPACQREQVVLSKGTH